jgi:hypothetical protein
MSSLRRRRVILVSIMVVAIAVATIVYDGNYQMEPVDQTPTQSNESDSKALASNVLAALPVKGRAPKTGYTREQFGDGWQSQNGCDTRNIILARDLTSVKSNDQCQVVRGTLADPYTGKVVNFVRGPLTSDAVQIDHVVALSNAWQTGAQQLSFEKRVTLANDPLELLAVDGPTNQQKGDGDAATWLPANKSFRCQYVARQLAVKMKYQLWLTSPEKQAMERILVRCPQQKIPG